MLGFSNRLRPFYLIGFFLILTATAAVKAQSSSPKINLSECPRTLGAKRPDAVAIDLRELGNKVTNVLKPQYPFEYRKKRITGKVLVDVVINEEGRVIWAKVLEGFGLLRRYSLTAACGSIFNPLKKEGITKKATFVLTYNFVK